MVLKPAIKQKSKTYKQTGKGDSGLPGNETAGRELNQFLLWQQLTTTGISVKSWLKQGSTE